MTPHLLVQQFPLGDRPSNWSSAMTTYWVLTYTIDTNGKLVFSYKEPTAVPATEVRSFQDLLSLTLSEPKSLLDLKVYDHTFIEIWLDPTLNMQWSRKYDAITTKDDYRQYYFELRLREGDTLYTVDQFPGSATPLVARFGALHRAHLPPENHGFSMNIELVDGQSSLPITIDPDIRNPSV